MYNIYSDLPTHIKRAAKIILFPVAIAKGVVYGMDNTTGDIVPFTFSRASSATLFDTDKNMQLVGNDVPRIDYGNYSDSAKLLIEKESTNLVLDNTNLLSGISKAPLVTLESFDWDNVINSSIAMHIPAVPSGTTTQYFYNILSLVQDTIYTYSMFFNALNSYPIIQADGYGYVGSDGGFSNNAFTPISKGMALNVQYRNNIGRFYSKKQAIVTSSNNVSGIGKTAPLLQNDLYCGGAQIEVGNTMTSYIPTSGSQVTRSADLLSINLQAASTIYLKTTTQETTLQKPAGLYNIHEDLNNEGIEYLAIV